MYENNLNSEKRLVKEFIISRLKEITQLGGFKSKGAGKISIEIEDNSE